MDNYALIGYPLGHSLSPQIHERLFSLTGTAAHYEKTEISPEQLTEKYDYLSSLRGFNVTIPHKLAIIDFCDRLDSGAARYGSVNCVKVGEERVGYNTDVLGFVKSIELMGAKLDSDVLLIGCGGVGRMIAIETALSGGRLTISVLDSDREKAEAVKKEITAMKPDARVEIIGSPVNDSDKRCDLLINATPIGMFPKTENMPCGEALLEKVNFVFDVVYNPKETFLTKKAREKGAKAMNGMAMLVLQAAAAHEIWYGASFKDSDLSRLISDMEELV